MIAFICGTCGQLLFFENTLCLRCSSPLGFLPDRLELAVLGPPGADPGRAATADGRRRCANAELASCNWMLEPGDPAGLCRSCRLTRTRPADGDAAGLEAFAAAEAAKRRLLFELYDLRLPVAEDTLRFDLLSSAAGPVSTGHADGLITIDLAESDDARREQRRARLGEPYRTVLGHFRHEIAHYYWPILVEAAGAERLARCRELFGDDRADYGEALERHYESNPPADWSERHVSAYATMHPWEDWAETFAHYLHIRDALQTASAFGVQVGGPTAATAGPPITLPDTHGDAGSIEAMIAAWLPLTYALNAVNRSMGQDDLYPFMLAPTVVEKLGFVQDAIRGVAGAPAS